MTTATDNSSAAPAHDVAIVGAGVVGCTVAWALTKAGRRVLLIDRADPATAGASFGNVGHVATEQLQPLPSPQLLLSFWRELVAFGGVLDIPLRRVAVMAPWMVRFALAAFQQRSHTQHLAPLVKNAADELESQLCEVGRGDLMRRNGHYALWLGPKAASHAAAERTRASNLGVATSEAPAELIRAAASAAAHGPNAAANSVSPGPISTRWRRMALRLGQLRRPSFCANAVARGRVRTKIRARGARHKTRRRWRLVPRQRPCVGSSTRCPRVRLNLRPIWRFDSTRRCPTHAPSGRPHRDRYRHRYVIRAHRRRLRGRLVYTAIGAIWNSRATRSRTWLSRGTL